MFFIKTFLVFIIFNLFCNSSFANNSLYCLAQVGYFEARSGTDDDILNTMSVVLNRVNSNKFPNTVCEVVYQKTLKTCQFSWYCKPHSIKDIKSFNRILTLAKISLKTKPTNSALFFHSKNIKNPWKNLTFVFKDNLHIYYK